MASSMLDQECEKHFESMQTLEILTTEQIISIRMVRASFDEDKYAQKIENNVEIEEKREKAYRLAIRYELLILDEMRKRSNCLHRSKETAYEELASSIVRKIQKMYSTALSLYGSKTCWWYEYFRFLARHRMGDELSDAITNLTTEPMPVELGPDDYRKCIDYELNFGSTMNRVDELIVRARRAYPESEKIYWTIMHSELKKIEHEQDAIKSLNCIDLHYNAGLNQFMKNPLPATRVDNFFYEFLVAIDQYAFTTHLIDKIIHNWRGVAAKNGTLPNFLHKLSLRCISYQYVTCTCRKVKDELNGRTNVGEQKVICTKDKREQCLKCKEVQIKGYFRAFSEVLKECEGRPKHDEAEIIRSFIDIMLKMNEDRSCLVAERQQLLHQAFENKLVQKYATEQQFARCIQHLFITDPEDKLILRLHLMATEKYPSFESAWIDYMKYFIRRQDYRRVYRIYNEAKQKIDEDCTDIHLEYVRFFMVTLPLEKWWGFFEQAINKIAQKTSTAFDNLKAEILFMIRDSIGFEYAKIVYTQFYEAHNNCQAVHKAMLAIQRDEPDNDVDMEYDIWYRLNACSDQTHASQLHGAN